MASSNFPTIRTLLICSQVTYLPDGGTTLVSQLLNKHQKQIVAVILIQNVSWSLYFTCLWLQLMGCRGLARTLFGNVRQAYHPPIEQLANARGIPVIKVKDINHPQFVQWVRSQMIDLIVNVRTRTLYRRHLLESPRLGCFNIHHGLLPTYRGMYCDLYALFEGRPAGITLHRMNQRIDDGQIIHSKVISKPQENDYLSYLAKTGQYEAKLIGSLISYCQLHNRPPNGRPNFTQNVVYTRRPSWRLIKDMQKKGLRL